MEKTFLHRREKRGARQTATCVEFGHRRGQAFLADAVLRGARQTATCVEFGHRRGQAFLADAVFASLLALLLLTLELFALGALAEREAAHQAILAREARALALADYLVKDGLAERAGEFAGHDVVRGGVVEDKAVQISGARVALVPLGGDAPDRGTCVRRAVVFAKNREVGFLEVCVE